MIACIHAPAFGSAEIAEGKSEQRKNGAAIVEPNTNMPTAAARCPPWLNCWNMSARNGIEQENDVSARVTAMKKTPMRPPRDSAREEALSHDDGSRISNSPSRLSPNTTNATPKSRLSQGLLPILVGEARKTPVMSRPISVYMLMMARL